MTTTTLRRLASRVVVVLAASQLYGCATHPARPISTSDLGVARKFSLFTVYWVGRSFDGVPLTAADTQRDYDAVVGERVYYGNCDKLASIVSTVGCRLPLEIATVDFYKIDSRRNIGLGKRTNTAIRGVPAVIFNGGRSIQLYSARLAIDIYADTAARALAAAQMVSPMNRTTDPGHGQLRPPEFAKDVDPELRAIERSLSAARAVGSASAAGRASAPAAQASARAAGGASAPVAGRASARAAGGASAPVAGRASAAPPAVGPTFPAGRTSSSTQRSKAS